MSFAKEMKDFVAAMSATSRIRQGWTDDEYKKLKMQYLEAQIKDYPQNQEFKRSLQRMQLQSQQLQQDYYRMRNEQYPQDQEDKHRATRARTNFYEGLDKSRQTAPSSGAEDVINGNDTAIPAQPAPPTPPVQINPNAGKPTSENDDGEAPDLNQNVGSNEDDDLPLVQSASTGGAIADIPDTNNENDDYNPNKPVQITPVKRTQTAIPTSRQASGSSGSSGSAGGVPSIDRSQFQAELQQNPQLVNRMANMVAGEVSLGHDPVKERIQLETAFNRAQARGIPLSQALKSVSEGKGGYYAKDTYTNHGQLSTQQLDYFKKNILTPVMNGSNTSQEKLGFVATGNASEGNSNFASRRADAGIYHNHAWLGNEMYVTEGNRHDIQFASNYGQGSGFASGARPMPTPSYSGGSSTAWKNPDDAENGQPTQIASRGSAIPLPRLSNPGGSPDLNAKDLGSETHVWDNNPQSGNGAVHDTAAGDAHPTQDANGNDATPVKNDGPGTVMVDPSAFATNSPAGGDYSFGGWGGEYANGGMVQHFAEGGMVGEDDDEPETETAIPATSQGNEEEDNTEANDQAEDYQATQDMRLAASGGAEGGVPYSVTAARDAVATGLAMKGQGGEQQVAASTPRKAIPDGPTPGVAASPRVTTRTTRYGTSTGGEVGEITPQEMAQLKQKVQAQFPNHKLTEGELNMGAYSLMQQYYTKRGDLPAQRAAGRMAQAMLDYNKRAWTTFMPIAAAAADGGDLNGAAKALSSAYAQIPNGNEIKWEPGQDGKSLNYSVVRYSDGQVIHQGNVDVAKLGGMAKQWGGPGTFDMLVKESVKGPAQPDQTVKPTTATEMHNAGRDTQGADQTVAADGQPSKSMFPAGTENEGKTVMQDIFASTPKLGQGAVSPQLAAQATTALFTPPKDPKSDVQIQPQQDGGALIRMPGSQITMRISRNALTQAMAIRGAAQQKTLKDAGDQVGAVNENDLQAAGDAAAEAKSPYSTANVRKRQSDYRRASQGTPAEQ